jgi:hypothetical protein
MARVILGLMIILSLDTMNLKNFPCSTAKKNFLGLKDIPYLRHHSRMVLR